MIAGGYDHDSCVKYPEILEVDEAGVVVSPECVHLFSESAQDANKAFTMLKMLHEVENFSRGQVNTVLLSNAGKSATLKSKWRLSNRLPVLNIQLDFRITYARDAWNAECASWRSVIQLNLVRSIITIIETLQAEMAGDTLPPTSLPCYRPQVHLILRLLLPVAISSHSSLPIVYLPC